MREKTTAAAIKPKAKAHGKAVASVSAPLELRRDKSSFFLPYQQAWIRDNSRLKVMEKGRQIGLSWSTAYGLVRRKAQRGARVDAWVSSRDDLQARLFKEDCDKFGKILQVACEDLGEQVIDKEKNISAYVLSFASGVRIHSMSSNPDAQAGKVGDRVLDEFALHPDPRKLWSIAYPGITWGGMLEVISTHRGEANLFNKIILEAREGGNPMGISLHRVTLQDALDQGFLAKLKSKLPEDDPRQAMDEAAYFDFIRAGCVDEESFLQEYMCVPADEQGAFISYDLIDGCTYGRGEIWEAALDPAGVYYMGVDVGRKHDLTVLSLLERTPYGLETRRVLEMRNTKFSDQMAAIGRYAELPWVRRVCVDATGIGCMLAEELTARHGRKVEGVTFTNGVKEDLANTLRRAMEDRRLLIPDKPELISDLRSIRKETTSAGNVRYVGERNADGHADRFWSLALAIHAAKPCGAQHFGVLSGVRPGSGRPRVAPGVFAQPEKRDMMRFYR